MRILPVFQFIEIYAYFLVPQFSPKIKNPFLLPHHFPGAVLIFCAGALSSPRAGDRASGGLRPSSGLPTQTTADCRTMTRSPGAVTIYPLARACPRRAVNSSRPPIRNPLKTQQAHGRALRAASFSRAPRARCAGRGASARFYFSKSFYKW